MFKGAPIRLPADFLAETFQAIREYSDIFKVLIEKQNKKLLTKNTVSSKTVLQR